MQTYTREHTSSFSRNENSVNENENYVKTEWNCKQMKFFTCRFIKETQNSKRMMLMIIITNICCCFFFSKFYVFIFFFSFILCWTAIAVLNHFRYFFFIFKFFFQNKYLKKSSVISSCFWWHRFEIVGLESITCKRKSMKLFFGKDFRNSYCSLFCQMNLYTYSRAQLISNFKGTGCKNNIVCSK